MRDSFIHITDLHFWEVITNPFRLLNKRLIGNVNVILKRRHDFIMQRAWHYVDYVASLSPKEVIITGDFTSTSTQWEFEQGLRFCQALSDAGKQVTVIPGNHDVYTFASQRDRIFAKHFFPWLTQEPSPVVQNLAGGTPVLYIPTVCPNAISSMGRVTSYQLDAAALLLDRLESPVIIAAHYPFLNETLGYTIKPNRRLRNADRLQMMLGESGKEILYVSGHVHRFSDTVDPRYPNIRHLTSGAFFRTAPESNADGDLTVVEVSTEGTFELTRHLHHDGAWHTQ
ncbi:MAG: metallophosphoesterase [Candidatus Hydrogenedentota bacterium]